VTDRQTDRQYNILTATLPAFICYNTHVDNMYTLWVKKTCTISLW